MSKSPREMLYLLLLIVAVSLIFTFSTHVRAPWFGQTNTLDAGLSTGTLLFARHWYHEGIWATRAGLLWDPASIEFPTLSSRETYTTYPPGYIVPIHIIAGIVGREPTVMIIMVWNLANQLAIGVVLALLALVLGRRLGLGNRTAFFLALSPPVVQLLAPASLYHHLMGFFPDQAVLVIFTLSVFVEILRDGAANGRTRTILEGLQGVLFFAGILTDYLFCFVALCIFLKRLMHVRPSFWFKRRAVLGTVLFWLPILLGGVLFIAQRLAVGGLDELYARFLGRTGLSAENPWSLKPIVRFWTWHGVRGFGWTGLFLIWGSLAFCLLAGAGAGLARLRRWKLSREATQILEYACLLTFPCYMQALFLRNHCAHPFHYYTALKFVLPLAVTPFCLAPLFIYALVCRRKEEMTNGPGLFRRSIGVLAPLILLALAIGYVALEWPRVKPQFRTTVSDPTRIATAEFIHEVSRYEDVLFAWDFDLQQNASPLYLAFSMKRVYPGLSLQQLYDKLASIQGEYVVNIVARREGQVPGNSDLGPLLARASEILRSKEIRIVRIPKERFLETCRQAGITAVTAPQSEAPADKARNSQG